jgi:hypothetical protein
VRRLHDVNSSGKKLFLLLIPIVGLVFITIELTFDSIPESNMYGESLKYPKDNKVILSPDAVDKSKLHNKDSQDTTEELPLEDTPTEDTDNAIK